MKKVAVLFIVFSLVACTTYSNDHYSLMSQADVTDTDDLAFQIDLAIWPILSRYGLSNAMNEKMPDSVLLYYSSGGDSALRVGIRITEGMVVLDTFQYRSGAGDSEYYSSLREELLQAMAGLNGVELIEIDGPVF